MAAYDTAEVGSRYHQAIVAWQKKNFPELSLLTENWDKYFKGQTPFQLCAKIGDLKSDLIEFGNMKGQKKFDRAGELRGGMFYGALGIIKAQCSTEFGSIQQHRETLEGAIDDAAKYAILRIMAEELRHAYQMFWVLEHDPSWKKLGMGNVAEEAMDELLAMETGSHVLDAFNIHYRSFMDNAIFAGVIDLVGKYQLEMQKVFSYSPVARSMQPMLSEEGFHLATGRNLMRKMAVAAAKGEGRFSKDQIQRTINMWLPRGTEMFGNEESGHSSLAFGFKDRLNGEAQGQYLAETQGIIDDMNADVVRLKQPKLSAQEAKALAARVLESGDAEGGIAAADLYTRPERQFFRRRGPDSIRFKPYDVDGNLMTKNGVEIALDDFYTYLDSVLPEGYRESSDFARHLELKKLDDEQREKDTP